MAESEAKEEWRTPNGYAPYQVSNFGRLRGGDGKIISGSLDASGYRKSDLSLAGKSKNMAHHRLVALAFLPNPERKKCVNHRNGDRSNNKVSNLEWVTVAENCARQVFPNRNKDLSNVRRAVRQLTLEGEFVQIWESQTAAAKGVSVSDTNIQACCAGKQKSAGGFRWENVDKPKVELLPGEVWVAFGYEGVEYYGSNKGRILLKTGGVTLGSIRNGYRIGPNNHPVHRLIATAFKPNPENKPCVNHIDGNSLNDEADNLEWVTYSENTRHAIATGLMPPGGRAQPVAQYEMDGSLVRTYDSIAEASRQTGFNSGNIGSACRGQTYRTVGGYKWEYLDVPHPMPPENPNPENPNLRYTRKLPVPNVDPFWAHIGLEDAPKIPVTAPTVQVEAKVNPVPELNGMTRKGNWRQVQALNMDGTVAATYPSVSEAARQLYCSSGNISAACSGKVPKDGWKRNIVAGYWWRYLDLTPAQPVARPIAPPTAQPTIPATRRLAQLAAQLAVQSTEASAPKIADDDPLWDELDATTAAIDNDDPLWGDLEL